MELCIGNEGQYFEKVQTKKTDCELEDSDEWKFFSRIFICKRSQELFSLRAGAHLAFLPSCNTVAFLKEDDDICIWIYEFTLYIFTVQNVSYHTALYCSMLQ